MLNPDTTAGRRAYCDLVGKCDQKVSVVIQALKGPRWFRNKTKIEVDDAFLSTAKELVREVAEFMGAGVITKNGRFLPLEDLHALTPEHARDFLVCLRAALKEAWGPE